MNAQEGYKAHESRYCQIRISPLSYVEKKIGYDLDVCQRVCSLSRQVGLSLAPRVMRHSKCWSLLHTPRLS